jgi:hypothetical protein
MSPHISKHLQWMNNQLRVWSFFISWQNSKQSMGVEPFGGFSMSTLDNFLHSDQNFVQLPRLLSQFDLLIMKRTSPSAFHE